MTGYVRSHAEPLIAIAFVIATAVFLTACAVSGTS
jgi:hypothetical protein